MGRPTRRAALGRPATGLGRYYMDCGWYRHPKFAGLPIEALFLFEAGVGYSTEHATNGRMAGDLEQLSLDLGIKLTVVRRGAAALIHRNAWRIEDGHVLIVGFTDHNPLAEEVAEYSELQRVRSTYGNHVRHHVNKQVTKDDCPHCRTSLANLPSEPPAEDIASEPITSDSHGMGWDGNPHQSDSRGDQPNVPNGAGEQARPADEEATLEATWRRLADHDLARHLADGNEVGNHPGWLRTATERRRTAHEARAIDELHANPNLTAEQLAETLDSACGPEDGGRARALAENHRTEQRRALSEAIAAWEAEADRRITALPPAERQAIEQKATQRLGTHARRAAITAQLRQHVMGDEQHPAELAARTDGSPHAREQEVA